MITTILLVVAACVALFILLVALRPSHFRITRSANISAPPEIVFAHVNDLHLFQDWSPWAKKEPEAEMSFSGPRTGAGSVCAWRGKKVGEGIMTLTESRANELVRFRLEFVKPFAVTNTAEFAFVADGPQTEVTWSMSGESRFLCKAIGLFVNMDKMCGRNFEQGLANLRAIAESEAGTGGPSDMGKTTPAGNRPVLARGSFAY